MRKFTPVQLSFSVIFVLWTMLTFPPLLLALGFGHTTQRFESKLEINTVRDGILMVRHRGGMPHGLMHSEGFRGMGVCPQPRSTPEAPENFLKMENPLKPIRPNILAGKELFHFEAQPTACKICHGLGGNGLGIMAQGSVPMPRNFTCKETMKNISDGQMFYIITYGSQGTNMPSYRNLSDEQVWQLIIYIRTLTN